MMNEGIETLGVIYKVIDELNQFSPDDRKLEKSPATVLFGPSGRIDSLGLVNLILAVEEAINDEYDIRITIADEKAMSQKNSPFATVGTLAEYVFLLVNQHYCEIGQADQN